LIKRTDSYHYINFDSIIGKNIRSVVRFLTIFILISTLVLGSAASSWNVYGQSNETNSQREDSANIIPNTAEEQNNEDTDKQSSLENGSSGNDSENTSSSQTILQKSNSQIGAAKSQPDRDCLFDPSLPKCAPDENGKCPDGFHMNGYEQCFPAHDKCPSGYHSHEDDESGRCIPDSVPCDPGYIMSPDFPTCEYKDSVCKKHPTLNECKVDDNTANNLPYKSGYSHGCSDAKISDSSKRYINQPGKGPSYHTPDFMSGYNDGFETCSNGNNQPNSKGTFKVIVQVTNPLSEDTYGGITLNVSSYPENVFKSAYGLYFPAGQTTSQTFTFKSSDVPVGTEFEVNLDYGVDYNQHIFGMNTPAKKPEVVQFFIS
jgi:hypothetical protein